MVIPNIGNFLLNFKRERTIYNMWEKLWNGNSKKTKLYIADTEGLPIETTEYEFPAVLDFKLNKSNTMGVTKAENKYVYQESIMQELEAVSITAEIRKEHADELSKFMIPGNWCFICHYKSMGGSRQTVFVDPSTLSKRYQMVSLSIQDTGFHNSLSAQCEFTEVRTYELQKASAGSIGTSGSNQNKPKKIADKGRLEEKEDKVNTWISKSKLMNKDGGV